MLLYEQFASVYIYIYVILLIIYESVNHYYPYIMYSMYLYITYSMISLFIY